MSDQTPSVAVPIPAVAPKAATAPQLAGSNVTPQPVPVTFTAPVKKSIHPKVKAAGTVSAVLGVVFTVLAAVGIVVPQDAQNLATTLAVDIAAAAPVVAGYLKR